MQITLAYVKDNVLYLCTKQSCIELAGIKNVKSYCVAQYLVYAFTYAGGTCNYYCSIYADKTSYLGIKHFVEIDSRIKHQVGTLIATFHNTKHTSYHC